MTLYTIEISDLENEIFHNMKSYKDFPKILGAILSILWLAQSEERD